MSELLAGLVNGPIGVRTSEGIAHIIRTAILGGRLPPGKSLPERRLAEELKVSRTPVREALFTLQGEGLVDLSPGRCGRVRHVIDADIKHIYSLRRMLESYAASCAAELQDKAKLIEAENALSAQKRLGSSGSALEQAKADLAFHEAITAAAGNQLLLTLMRQVLAVTVTYRASHNYSAKRTKHVYAQHSAILKAVQAGDADGACALMAKHITESGELALKTMKGVREMVEVRKIGSHI